MKTILMGALALTLLAGGAVARDRGYHHHRHHFHIFPHHRLFPRHHHHYR